MSECPFSRDAGHMLFGVATVVFVMVRPKIRIGLFHVTCPNKDGSVSSDF